MGEREGGLARGSVSEWASGVKESAGERVNELVDV